jgi:hypothetical protein
MTAFVGTFRRNALMLPNCRFIQVVMYRLWLGLLYPTSPKGYIVLVIGMTWIQTPKIRACGKLKIQLSLDIAVQNYASRLPPIWVGNNW